ncbi:hypothetical protein NC653_016835 [Populus alba x Populus x berolinensis]|uniref:Uncharacterized protein n=1 Tax=Populus alba x Populus x berolinensis TaxID=444605 RepID=A0AAD6W091_9ROSI|nr:hypothetical protein NC653_016835 [Populus alba x Populus x berolinensis]
MLSFFIIVDPLLALWGEKNKGHILKLLLMALRLDRQ